MTQENLIASTPPPGPPGFNLGDGASQSVAERNLYNSSFLGIISRNFLAGFFRGLGSILVYLMFLAIVFYIFQTYVAPELKPLLDTFEQLGKLQTQQSQIELTPEEMQSMLQQMRN